MGALLGAPVSLAKILFPRLRVSEDIPIVAVMLMVTAIGIGMFKEKDGKRKG